MAKREKEGRALVKSVRFSDDDWKIIEAAAKRGGLDPATYIRTAAVKAARRDTGQ